MTRVDVKWLDIVSDGGGWSTLSEALEYHPLTVETQGWLVHENEDFIIIVSTLSPPLDDEEPSVGGIHAIPRGCILRINEMAYKQS